MIALEKYLIEQGFEKFVMNTKTMKLEKTDKHVISSMVNLDHRYFKDGIQVIIGLNEQDKPVTLIYPRMGFNSDNEMNRYLWDNEPSKILIDILAWNVINIVNDRLDKQWNDWILYGEKTDDKPIGLL